MKADPPSPQKRKTPVMRPVQPRRVSPLTVRILAVNLIALIFLVGGIFYVDDLRQTLLRSRIDALLKDAHVMAGALGEAATTGPSSSKIELIPARQIIIRLVGETGNRTRFFGLDGKRLIDSRDLAVDQSVVINELPPETQLTNIGGLISDYINHFLDRMQKREPLEQYREVKGEDLVQYEEVLEAANGNSAYRIRQLNEEADMITVAVPVQRFRRVLGVLMLSVDTREINATVRETRMTILSLFTSALIITLMLSTFLARTIVRPILRLASSADRIKAGTQTSSDIPDYSGRNDEIGDLSRSLKDMTNALARQIDAVASFAADVAHELKNPLTSMRSAMETLEYARTDEDREKLVTIIRDDINRLDRLISDISDASRLDAEMSRSQTEPVNLTALLETLIDIYHTTQKDMGVDIHLDFKGRRKPKADKSGKVILPAYFTRGLEGQLGQVARNLIDNALSFSLPGGNIYLSLSRRRGMIEFIVEDEGVGIPEAKLEDIFARFYSERPKGEAFGKHSGLGLSICKQIIESHGGTITAENRQDKKHPDLPGARFIVRLPDAPETDMHR